MVTSKKTRTENILYPPSHSNMRFPRLLDTHPHTHTTTTESSYIGFNSLNRCSGSLGIGIKILRNVVYFLHCSSSLIEVDGLWSWWACESKTCTQTRLGITHGWHHPDVILICQSETYPEWDYFYPNDLMRWWKFKEEKDKEIGRWMSVMTSRTLLASIIGFLLFLCTYIRW